MNQNQTAPDRILHLLESKIAEKIYDFLERLDSKAESYSYETAPYCGHHFSGCKGKYITANYHEGVGVCEGKIFCIKVYKFSEEKLWKLYFVNPFKKSK